jgi:hypothetical protein
MINHSAGLIVIEAFYDGVTAPSSLIPVFSATGNVSINGVSKTSGVTAGNYSSITDCVVINPSNPTLRRDYRIEVIFVRTFYEAAEISSFIFYTADNPGLIADVTAVIDQATGAITATLLFNTPGGSRTLYPRFSHQGSIDSGGIAQVSGVSGHQFYSPVSYRVVSANGANQKTYTVTVKEVNSRIYVQQSAVGRNDGTNWQNAYTNMPNAVSDAQLLPDNLSKNIWIAQGTYTPTDRGNVSDYLRITPNTSYIGGFAGNETTVGGRVNPQNNRATITGNLGGSVRSLNLFGRFDASSNSQTINGDVDFEYLNFTSANSTTASNDRVNGAAINVRAAATGQLVINHCNFNSFTGASSGTLRIQNGTTRILSSVFENSSSTASQFSTGFGVVYIVAPDIEVKSTSFRNNTSTVLNINSSQIGGSVTIDNVVIDGMQSLVGARSITVNSNNPVLITNSQIRNATSGISLNILNNSTAEVSHTVIENITQQGGVSGGGISQFGNNAVFRVNDVTFRNIISQGSGAGISLDSNNFIIEHSRFEDVTSAGNSGKILYSNNSANTGVVRHCTFIHTSALRNPGSYGNNEPSFFKINTTFENCTFTNLRSLRGSGQHYLFNRWTEYPSPGGLWSPAYTMTLRGCTFNFNAGSAGLMAFVGGNPIWYGSDRILLDGVRIYNNGGQQPLIWLHNETNAPSGTYQFRNNNFYNNQPLNNANAIIGLGNVIRLEGGAVPSMVP